MRNFKVLKFGKGKQITYILNGEQFFQLNGEWYNGYTKVEDRSLKQELDAGYKKQLEALASGSPAQVSASTDKTVELGEESVSGLDIGLLGRRQRRDLRLNLEASGTLTSDNLAVLNKLNDIHSTNMNTAANWASGIGALADIGSNVLGDQSKSSTTLALNSAYDTTSNMLMQSGTPWGMIAGGAMKVAGFGADALTKAGVGTDQMTFGDKLMGSKFMYWDPVSLINNGFAKSTNKFEIDQELQARQGSAYADTYLDMTKAQAHAGKKYGLFSSRSRRKWNSNIAEADRKLELLSNIDERSQDALAMSRDPRIGMRSQTELTGGFNANSGNVAVGKEGLKFAKRVLNPDNWYYVIENAPEKLLEGGKTNRKYPTFESFMRHLRELEKDEPDFMYEDFYNDDEAYKDWEDWDSEDPKGAHLNGNYKKRTHKTYDYRHGRDGGVDANYGWFNSNPDEKGIWHYKVHPEKMEQYTFDDYVNYWKEKEPEDSILLYGNRAYSNKDGEIVGYSILNPKILYKQGGSFNVIPEGALHARLHHMEDGEESKELTSKGIPVVTKDSGGEMTLHAEIEVNEIILNLELTKKLEEMGKQFHESDDLKKKDDLAIEAGKILVKEILTNTVDNTGLLKQVK